MEGLGILALALVVPLALGGLGGGGGDDEAEQTEDTSLDELPPEPTPEEPRVDGIVVEADPDPILLTSGLDMPDGFNIDLVIDGSFS